MEEWRLKQKANIVKKACDDIKNKCGLSYSELMTYYYQYQEVLNYTSEIIGQLNHDELVMFYEIVEDRIDEY